MFQLDKWYGDLTTDSGACAIIYSARLQWGPMRLGYAATIHLSADRSAPPREATTWRGGSPPLLDGDRITWRNHPLRVTADWQRDAPTIARRLAAGPNGEIEWTCHFPRARARVQIGTDRIEGLGYVERLRLTIPPWRLPFRALRWGRHLSADHCLVWIAWSGGDTRRWVWLDGVEQPAASVGEHGVAGLEGGAELRWSESRDLRNHPLLTSIAGPVPAFVRRLAGPLARWHEHKRLSPSAIVHDGRPLDHGWTVRETVTW